MTTLFCGTVYDCPALSAHLLTTHREHFDSWEVIWDRPKFRWFQRCDCIWDGPGFINSKAVLSESYGNNNPLKMFFKNVLDIGDWTPDDIIAELEVLSNDAETIPSLPLVRSIYAFLDANVRSEEDWQTVKYE